MLKLIEEEEKPILKTKEKNEVELNIVAANNDASAKVIDKLTNQLVRI